MKNRHIHMFPEKYGHHDVFDEFKQVLRENIKVDAEDLFQKLPYVGYLYIPATSDFGNWWYDTNDDHVTAKVLRVNEVEGTVDFAHFDSHHHSISYRRVMYDGYLIKGNLLIKAE